MLNELSVVIISSGINPHLNECLREWCIDFTLGEDLFICGPEKSLKTISYEVPSNAIIDFDSNSNYSFPINRKKKTAFDNIDSNYLYIVHDRFYPSLGFKDDLLSLLNDTSPDFGAVDTYNLDGSLSLSELRVRNSVLHKTNNEFLLESGRSSCLRGDPDASSNIALNGGQFF